MNQNLNSVQMETFNWIVMESKIKLLALVVVIAIVAATALWVLPIQKNVGPIGPPGPTPSENIFAGNGPKIALASFYEPENVSIEPSVTPYSLPLDLNSVVNFSGINSSFGLTERQIDALKRNGFVVVPWGSYDDVVDLYKELKMENIPVFVTSDTLLHLYHVQFDEILKDIENNEFFDEIKAMSEAMLEESFDQYSMLDGDLKEAARRNVAYFAVGLKLLEPDAVVPDLVKNEVNAEIQLIEQHSGFAASPIFKYQEDYSQYVPRGHYTQDERLKKYFKAMMWYGRIAFLLRGDPDTIPEEDAKIQTMGASLIASSLDNVKADNASVGYFWNRIYAVTSFFVGLADDLTPYEYKEAISKVFGENFDAVDLENDEQLLNLKATLANMRSPEIYGGTGNIVVLPPFSTEKLKDALDETKGMRFMGQRYVPDSYMFQNLVYPAVGSFTGIGEPFTLVSDIRGFPRGLDVMAVLGSDRAYEILRSDGDTAYENYGEQLSKLRGEFAAFDENNWNRNLYWSWMYTLKALLMNYGDGYQTFMQTKAWQDKELNTALASWTELRHDTILYAKQSYTFGMGLPPQPKPVVGYVEPVPEFYARILALTKMTNKGLTTMNVLDQTSKERLEHLENILSRLLTITEKELRNEELAEEDYEFIRNFGEELAPTVAGVESRGKETTMVADVHTDANSGKVLEEGGGYADLILVAYKVPDGRIIMGAGPVLSHYEFKWPMQDRLTDEKWKDLLKSEPPAREDWVKSFYITP
jgi:hypothetical protein